MAGKTLEIRWGVEEEVGEQYGDALGPAAIGFEESELAELVKDVPGVREVAARPTSIGVGASGYGLALVIEIERWLGNAANLVEVGVALTWLIRRVAKRHRRRAVIVDPDTLGALA